MSLSPAAMPSRDCRHGPGCIGFPGSKGGPKGWKIRSTAASGSLSRMLEPRAQQGRAVHRRDVSKQELSFELQRCVRQPSLRRGSPNPGPDSRFLGPFLSVTLMRPTAAISWGHPAGGSGIRLGSGERGWGGLRGLGRRKNMWPPERGRDLGRIGLLQRAPRPEAEDTGAPGRGMRCDPPGRVERGSAGALRSPTRHSVLLCVCGAVTRLEPLNQ